MSENDFRSKLDVNRLVEIVRSELDDPSKASMSTNQEILQTLGAPEASCCLVSYWLRKSGAFTKEELKRRAHVNRAISLRSYMNQNPGEFKMLQQAGTNALLAQSKKQLRKAGRKSLGFISGGFKFRGVELKSSSEVACLAIISKYLPSFEAVVGETVYVDVGGYEFDFLVSTPQEEGALIEYHPLMFANNPSRKQFPTQDDEIRYWREIETIPLDKRKTFTESFVLDAYRRARERIVANDEIFSGMPVIFASNKREFCSEFAKKFLPGSISMERIVSEWSFYHKKARSQREIN